MILDLLRHHWVAVLSTTLAVTLLINSAIVTEQRDTARAQRDEANAQLAFLTDLTARQNEAVRALEAAAQQNREVYLAGIEAANRKAVRLEIKAEDLLSMPAPTNPSEQCEAARALLVAN